MTTFRNEPMHAPNTAAAAANAVVSIDSLGNAAHARPLMEPSAVAGCGPYSRQSALTRALSDHPPATAPYGPAECESSGDADEATRSARFDEPQP